LEPLRSAEDDSRNGVFALGVDEYYGKRASEYEEIYRRDDPVRQRELAVIVDAVRKHLAGKRVFEVACGTGYWTEIASEVATSIVGVDFSREMLAVARSKRYGCDVDFVVGDAYCPSFRRGSFGAGLAGFWFSHVPRVRVDSFLSGFCSVLGSGSVVFLADNVFVAGVGGELVEKSGEVDTFKLRRLRGGSEFLVVKNYYSREELVDLLSPYARGLMSDNVWFGEDYWFVFFEVL